MSLFRVLHTFIPAYGSSDKSDFGAPRLLQVPDGEFGLLFTDGSKFGRAEQLHMALLGLWAFQTRKGRLPAVGDAQEAEAVVDCAEKVQRA